MPRRNRRMPSRESRRRNAIRRELKDAALRARTVKQTRKQARREQQKQAWAKLPDWIGRRSKT